MLIMLIFKWNVLTKEFREGSSEKEKFTLQLKTGQGLEKQGKAQVSSGLCNLKYSDDVLKNKTKHVVTSEEDGFIISF